MHNGGGYSTAGGSPGGGNGGNVGNNGQNGTSVSLNGILYGPYGGGGAGYGNTLGGQGGGGNSSTTSAPSAGLPNTGGGGAASSNDYVSGAGGSGIIIISYTYIYPCFLVGTKILSDKGYIKIEDLKKGDLIKTLNNGYKAIDMIGKKEIYHHAIKERVKNQLYKYTNSEYNEIFEDLILTGCHCILIDNFRNEKEVEETEKINGKIYLTEHKFRLPACIDEKAIIYEKEGLYDIYHIALENENYFSNYGIYANGLLVETCSKRYLKELSNMEIIE